MPLTKESKEHVKARVESDPEYRRDLFCLAIDALLCNQLEMGKQVLRAYVNSTIGFESLARAMNKDPKSLMRMLSAKGNPRADNLLAMIAFLKRREGPYLSLTKKNGPHL